MAAAFAVTAAASGGRTTVRGGTWRCFAGGSGGKDRKLFFYFTAAALFALNGSSGAGYEFFKGAAAFAANVFVNRHGEFSCLYKMVISDWLKIVSARRAA